ncbi:hypothetical protein [Methylobacterium radiotolerans]|uniref:Uncharacterized protein n=1 Tax=Methylobacterium radiotolerans (strain ATCC 27329 / DSM 1819 / JCM 2831 / NBRC 15690 / NCIMB 10815 / 0-1) TaxID=426355 RepID=B1MA67_METRJ|nr:hypothetical protein [Methylobacterium radiotolerans]ACB28392.1 conserved hypothetical protein [Methylobacterium radiotolerans JCM 2831]
MSQDSTLAKALADVRRQRAALEADFERVGAELTKLRLAERSLASIVEGTPLEDLPDEQPRRRASAGDDQARGGRGAGRGPRGPRANSAKGRLKALLEEAGPQGLSHAQISDRLHDVAPNTLATYLSMMTTSGEVERHGDFYRGVASVAEPVADTSDSRDPDGVEHAPAEEG